ncbi:putative cystathionine gamma-synthase/beta-lyase [Cladorrhinum sp. PSN332]|nr:putative cystathionine gamma-synthase/beta-lyase [Cladorrhinum sp. PSN332]
MESPENLRLGEPLPKGDPNAISVQLPTWRDNVGWAERDPAVLEAMTTGYPRFFIPRVVTSLSESLLAKAPIPEKAGLSALPFAALLYAAHFVKYMSEEEETDPTNSPVQLYLVQWNRGITWLPPDRKRGDLAELVSCGEDHIFLVTFPTNLTAKAKKFVQHTGYGISSRRAKLWEGPPPFVIPELCHENSQEPPAPPACCKVCRYNEVFSRLPRTQDGYLIDADHAEKTLRWRIAACARGECHLRASNGFNDTEAETDRPRDPKPEAHTVDPDKDVYLYPTGMTAIGGALRVIMHKAERPRVAVIGFLYLDTIKLLQLVLGEDQVTIFSYDQIDLLEKQLRLGVCYEAVFTEFPGNPLLQSPDLLRLREMSLTYDFYLVVDDTIGTSVALNLLDYCDIICTSLTKMFSGGCNVMGGSTVLNPRNPKSRLDSLQESFRKYAMDKGAYFGEDVIVMERNSRDFVERVLKASQNAEAMLELFKASPAVKNLSYPKGSKTQDIYDKLKRPGAGYGFLMSIEFCMEKQAMAFYDNFDVAKGPSLGTNFTLCCPYSILAHYREQEWAASHGVVPHLVRISFGLEDRKWLHERVMKALSAAEIERLDQLAKWSETLRGGF